MLSKVPMCYLISPLSWVELLQQGRRKFSFGEIMSHTAFSPLAVLPEVGGKLAVNHKAPLLSTQEKNNGSPDAVMGNITKSRADGEGFQSSRSS